jgi:hypothetical protein
MKVERVLIKEERLHTIRNLAVAKLGCFNKAGKLTGTGEFEATSSQGKFLSNFGNEQNEIHPIFKLGDSLNYSPQRVTNVCTALSGVCWVLNVHLEFHPDPLKCDPG